MAKERPRRYQSVQASLIGHLEDAAHDLEELYAAVPKEWKGLRQGISDILVSLGEEPTVAQEAPKPTVKKKASTSKAKPAEPEPTAQA